MASSEYETVQAEEIESLQAIFAEEFQSVQTTSAWSQTPRISFRINLAISPEASDTAKTDVVCKVSLAVTFTATYPKTVPIIAIKDCENVPKKTIQEINHVLAVRPTELVGNQMIFTIADEIESIVKSAANARAQGSSLEEERAARAKETAVQAEKAREEAAQKVEEEKDEEDRKLRKVIQDEYERKLALTRRRASVRESTTAQTQLTEADVIFDHDITATQRDGLDSSFHQISFGKKIGEGPITEVFEAIPIRDKKLTDERAYVVKRVQVPKNKPKNDVVHIENILEHLKSLRHPNILSMYDFKVTSNLQGWEVDILAEFGTRGPLLEWCGMLQPNKARSVSLEIMEAVEFYHKNGIVHGNIHTRNIILSQTHGGVTTARLADAGYQQALHKLLAEDMKFSRANEIDLPWTPPESSTPEGPRTIKTDIWSCAIVFVHLFFGIDECSNYSNSDDFLNNASLSSQFLGMMRNMFRVDPKRRSNALEVIMCDFLRADANPTVPQATEINSGIPLRRRSSRSRKSGPEVLAGSSGQYRKNFDEAGRAGKGGYGDVFKARNKYDGTVYAIKKIKAKSTEDLSKVRSEVYTLARLNHPYIVRYYGSWEENDTPVDDR